MNKKEREMNKKVWDWTILIIQCLILKYIMGHHNLNVDEHHKTLIIYYLISWDNFLSQYKLLKRSKHPFFILFSLSHPIISRVHSFYFFLITVTFSIKFFRFSVFLFLWRSQFYLWPFFYSWCLLLLVSII